jgi:Cys-rich protein (TIGR01571 family)
VGLLILEFLESKIFVKLKFGTKMIPTSNGEDFTEAQEESTSSPIEYVFKANGNGALHVSTSRKGLLSDENPRRGNKDMSSSIPSRLRLVKISSSSNLASPSAKFCQIAEEKDEISRSVPSSTGLGFRERFSGVLAQKIDWQSLRTVCKEWIKNPLNMALLLWIICVAISGAILFLVMTGMLNGVLPNKSQRNTWFEVNNQIINALFTLMCLYQHPKRFHHLVLLCRWKNKDISALRKIYCKNGTYKPYEWAHMMVVVALLHLNCFAQYALCGLNLGYKRSKRPAVGVGICLSIAIAAPAIAGVYSIVSPLGREYDSEVDEEGQVQTLTNGSTQLSHLRRNSLEKRFSFALRNEHRIVEYAPKWKGGLFDVWDNISIGYLSLFCCFCVFGWNMERLGFGNMYVHIATFVLFCMAPFWIFNLAAINIDNEFVREALGLTGVVLCLFGLLYGGYWRIQMRKRFNLPANNIFCGKPAVADCTQWLFCCWCALAQEVRTADFYDIMEDKFCRKQEDENAQPPLSPLPREDGAVQFRSNPTSLPWNSSRFSKLRTENYSNYHHSPNGQLPRVQESSAEGVDNFMKPPDLSSMQRED